MQNLNSLDTVSQNPEYIKIPEHIKNGNNVGIMILPHIPSDIFIYSIVLSEFVSIIAIMQQAKTGSIVFLMNFNISPSFYASF